MSIKPLIFEKHKDELLTETVPEYSLVVWNDDVNTFDWVEKTLVEVCGHSNEQAIQCTLIIHYKGKCQVNKGDFDTLRQQCEAIINRSINATVEVIA